MEQKQENLIEIFNLGSGDSQSLRTIIEDIRMELELNVRLEFGKVPLPPYEPHHLVADVSHVREVLGWKPTTKLAYSIWQLAQEITPGLRLRKPERFREHV
jgi:nucleoside-diphosphate-sugar epimerase